MNSYEVTIRKTFTVNVLASTEAEAEEIALLSSESWKEVENGTFVDLIYTNDPAEIYRAFEEDTLQKYNKCF